MKYKFYDTCSLILKANHLWDEDATIVISTITLEELEHIKTAANKDPDVKFAARKVVHELDEHYDDYEVVIWNHTLLEMMNEHHLPLTEDSKIITCAKWFQEQHPGDEISFVTNDLCCKHIARTILNMPIESYIEEAYDYDGYKEVYLDTDKMSEFYCNQDKNLFDLHINEYLLVHDQESGDLVDRLCWTGEGYRHLSYDSFNSNYFGTVKPMKGDVYQSLAFDSLANNKITMIKGPAGTGKTYIGLGFLLHKLERGRIDKIIVFCNTVATKNSAKLGFYPGTRDEKLLDSQIGNLLISKFGDRLVVEQMINEEKLILLPLSDIRGYDTGGMSAGIYISEAQNLDIELMKLTLQRIGEDSICIIDGDCKAQVDDVHFAGSSNGMKRASWAYRGEDVYGEITLKNIYRSRIAQIAEKM